MLTCAIQEDSVNGAHFNNKHTAQDMTEEENLQLQEQCTHLWVECQDYEY